MEATYDVFPYEWSNATGKHISTGLKAIDYIAIHAMQALLANPVFSTNSYARIADIAYGQAKVMLQKS